MEIGVLVFNLIKKKLLNAGLTESLVHLNGHDIHYYSKQSDKETLMLVHGLGVSGELQWYKLVKHLAQKYNLILVNLLGFGASKPAESKDCTLADQLMMLQTLAQYLNIKQTKIAGISYGGLIASEFAELYPTMISELILIDTPTKFLDLDSLSHFLNTNGVQSVKHFFVPKDFTFINKQLALANFKKMWLPNFVTKSFYKVFCKPYLANWEIIVNDLLTKYEDLKSKDYKFNGKTLIIWGVQDQLIPIDVGVKLNHHYSNASLVKIEHCGHIPIIEQAKECKKYF